MSTPAPRKPTIAVCGAGRCEAELAALAEAVGRADAVPSAST